MNYIYSIIIGYLIGSIPTAFILLKQTHNLDITKSGSGNVGALNSFEVSNSKLIGVLVLLLDAAKGFLSAIIVYHFIGKDFIYPILSLIAAVLAHCYSPWLKFKGGRGLATAAGGALFISIPVFLIWAVLWLLVFVISRNIHSGNIVATIVSAIIPSLIGTLMMDFSFIIPKSQFEFSISIFVLMLIIFSKHILPLMELINYFKTRKV